MSIGRRLVLAGGAAALSLSLVAIVGVGSASAGNPPFKGPASGTVTCTGLTIKISFSPGLTLNNGQPAGKVSAKGKMSSCKVSGSTDTIHQAKITGTFGGGAGGCLGLAGGTTTPETFTIVWKGKHGTQKAKFDNSSVTIGGSAQATDASGHVGFELPNPGPPYGGGTTTGSFAGSASGESFAYSSESSTALGKQCASKHGLKKLMVTHGSLTLP